MHCECIFMIYPNDWKESTTGHRWLNFNRIVTQPSVGSAKFVRLWPLGGICMHGSHRDPDISGWEDR